MKLLSLIILALTLSFTTYSQCVVINEVLIDGGACDGSCNPNTAEWIELYNTCGSDADVSCFIICDGDWTYVIPDGTTILSGGFLTIGGATNEASSADLDWAGANYTGTGGIGTLTNGGEQVALFDNTGSMIDGVIWGGGQGLPDGGNSVTASGPCTVTSVDLPNSSNSAWEVLPSDDNDCSIARETDGSSTWVRRCRSDGDMSFGTSNGSLPLHLIPDTLYTPNIPDKLITKEVIMIFDVSGQQLHNESLHSLKMGCYIVHFLSSDGVYTRDKIFILK